MQTNLIGINICNGNGIILRINNVHEKIIGLPIDYMVGRSMKSVVEDSYIDRSVTMEVIEQMKTKGFASPLITEQVLYNGKRYMVHCSPLIDEAGNLKYIISQLLDITLNKLLKEYLHTNESAGMHTKVEIQNITQQLESCKEQSARDNTPLVLYASHAMKRIFSLIDHIKDSRSPVLIMGESGVGKELVAKYIHCADSRSDNRLVDVNCAALPSDLLESELFGYAPGTFTGGDPKGKLGLFEVADGGTLILDEIGEMPLKLQAKMLRVLQENEIRPVGASASVPVEVRIISMTNRNLITMLESGAFRKDLFYRLNVIPLVVPPLRDRREDIPLLAYYFLNRFNRKYNKKKTLSPNGFGCLTEQHYEGNVRQLENTIERLVMLGKHDTINADEVLHFYMMTDEKNPNIAETDMSTTLTLKERMKIDEENALRELVSQGMTTYQIAEVIGVNQSTAWRKIQKMKTTRT
jgi:PAS domain S-box-containing protein